MGNSEIFRCMQLHTLGTRTHLSTRHRVPSNVQLSLSPEQQLDTKTTPEDNANTRATRIMPTPRGHTTRLWHDMPDHWLVRLCARPCTPYVHRLTRCMRTSLHMTRRTPKKNVNVRGQRRRKRWDFASPYMGTAGTTPMQASYIYIVVLL